MNISRRPLLLTLVIAVAVCLFGFLSVALRRTRLSPPPVLTFPNTPNPLPPAAPVVSAFAVLWTRPAYDFQALALSPDAEFFALLTGRKRAVSLAGRDGKTRWSQDAPEARQVAVTRGGQAVLTWAALDPTQCGVSIRQGTDGELRARRTLDGAIWSAAIASNGTAAAWATGNRTVARVTLGLQPAFHTWTLAGIGNSIALSGDGATLVTGTWDESGAACWTAQGSALWNAPSQDPTRLFETQMSSDGRYVLGLSYDNARQRDGTLFLWRRNGDGKPLWTAALGADAFGPRALVSQDARIIAVTYSRQLLRDGGSVTEHQLRVFDRQGNVIGKSGGLLFTPTLIASSADGTRVTVSDGQKTLYHLDETGRFLPAKRFVLPGQIRQWAASEDGKILLIYTGDGTLSLLKLQ